MKKRKIIISTILLIFILVTTISAVAYFKINSNQISISDSRSLDGDIIEVSSYSDLFNYSKAKSYNDKEIEEKSSSRKTLQFKNDIVLLNNLEITANINIDLNGYYLYLNGKDINFNHSYYGSVQLYSNKVNGYIIPEEIIYQNDVIEAKENGNDGIININTPNAVVTINNNIVIKHLNEVILQTSSYINVLEFNELYYSYLALYKVSDSLLNYTDIRVEKLSLDDLDNNSLITNNNNILEFDSHLFVSDKEINNQNYCKFDNDINNCVFVYDNLDLIFNYLNYKDIEIDYLSSDESILSNLGEFSAPSNSTDINLEVYIKYLGEVVAKTRFSIHAVNKNSSDFLDVCETLVYSRIKNHYDSENNLYRIDRELIMPKLIEDVNISYIPYKKSTNAEAIELFNDGTKYLSLGTSTITNIDNYYINLAPTSETEAIGITFSKNNNSKTIYIKCLSANLIVNNESQIARDLVNEWYGGKILLTKNDESGNIYSTQILYDYNDINLDNYPSITSVRYELINDSHNLYQLSDISNSDRKLLSVVPDKVPEAYVQDVMLSCIFTINEKTVNIQIGIGVNVASTDTNSAFLPYYTYYDEEIKEKYNSYISKTFELPISYSNVGPIIVYDFVEIPQNYNQLDNKHIEELNPSSSSAFVLHLYYNETIQTTLTYTQGVSYTTLFDNYLGNDQSSRNQKLEEILNYGDAKWIFEYKISNVSNKNIKLGLVYNYKMSAMVNDWQTYCKNTTDEQILSIITVAGVLHYGTDVVDENFYKWIYDNFTVLTDSLGQLLTYTLGDYNNATLDSNNGGYVMIDWLSQNVKIDASTDSTIASIQNFKGLQYLTGTTYLKLVNSNNQGLITNSNTAIDLAREIAKMSRLETLILTNCTGFSDGYDLTNNDVKDNDSISRFVNLKNLSVLYMDGCNIILFDFLDSMTWLDEVHIENQTISTNDNYNNFYGNTGIANYWIFTDLTDAGVKVYTTYQGNARVLFEEQKVTNDYTRIKNGLLYQSQLADGEDIRNLYQDFSTNPDDYLLQTSYKYISGNDTLEINKNTRTITFDYVKYSLTKDKELDSNKTYYIKDSNSNSGYSVVSNPLLEDIGTYYEYFDQYHSKAFEAIYHFELTGSNSISINLTVKFNVERLNNE